MSTTPLITVVITAYNEEKNIRDCVESARLLTDDVLVVDTESTDKTAEIARELGCKVVSFPFKRYVEPSRNFAISSAKGEWVFILDADERITPEFAEDVKKATQTEKYSYFKVPRKNIFGHMRWLKHGGWYPDYATARLINKSKFVSWPEAIHSKPHMGGEEGVLQVPFIHLFHPNLESMVDKTAVYEDIEANMLYRAKRPVTVKTFFKKYFGELYRRMFKHRGFMDGTPGIIESKYQAYSKTITYLLLYEKYRNKENKSSTV